MIRILYYNQMASQTFSLFCKIILLTLFFFMGTPQEQMRMSPNLKYSYVGRVNINCNPLLAPSLYSITFPGSLVSQKTVAYVAWSGLKTSLPSSSFSLFVSVQDLTSSSINILIRSTTPNLISRFVVSYFLFRWTDQISYHNQHRLIFVQVEQTVNTAGSTTFDVPIEQKNIGNPYCYAMLNGMNLQGNSTSAITLSVSFSIYNSITLRVNVNFNNGGGILVSLSFFAVAYNYDYYHYYYYYYYNYGYNGYYYYYEYYYYKNPMAFYMNTQFINIPNRPYFFNYYYFGNSVSINTFVGLYSFYSPQLASLSFQVTSSDTSGFSLSTNQANSYYSFASLTIFSKYYCDYKTPYYSPITKKCYGKCFGNYIDDNYSLTCLPNPNNPIIYGLIGSIILIGLMSLGVYIIYRERKKWKAQRQKEQQMKPKQSQQKIAKTTLFEISAQFAVS